MVAEIKGTGPTLKEELVMVGGHLDSWHSAMGATDNAAGCAVMMGALRIRRNHWCKTRHYHPHLHLWGGEERGLHSSRTNYVHATTLRIPLHVVIALRVTKFLCISTSTTEPVRSVVFIQGNELDRAHLCTMAYAFQRPGSCYGYHTKYRRYRSPVV